MNKSLTCQLASILLWSLVNELTKIHIYDKLKELPNGTKKALQPML